jgi:hypothetical protein
LTELPLNRTENAKMKYRLKYLKNNEVETYRNISLVGSFANFTEDGKSNVGFQAINEEGEPRRFRYDGVKEITLMK